MTKKGEKLNKLKIVFEIIKIMAGSNKWLNVKTITKKLFEIFEEDINHRTVKQYLVDIQNQLHYELDIKRGPEGGYKLSNSTRQDIALISQLSLTNSERNALNDAFEIASKSLTYYYIKDLQSAINKLYLKLNLKDQDYEYYVGKLHDDHKVTSIIKQIKFATINKYKVEMESKYEYFGISKEKNTYKPLYLIHDLDESFVVMKNEQNEYIYQNISNIKSLNITNKKFIAYNENIDHHKNEHTLKIKGEYHLTFKIIDERGNSIFDLWNYDFEDITEGKNDHKKIIFYEEYKVYEFLFRIQKHIVNLKLPDKIKAGWNERIANLKKII